ncbi:MAG: hypothetical protein UR39_C0003G0155 [Candidatus Woesebacteria bacterium GW2011_GWA1_33_30]|uniref:Uncharacterized protein n=1 Tax=Candidatus Woesebacteria bacterium GW2011_GWA2_33_28 TaxID=1618561 RepID=A0A0F9ZTV7_9BACT|nr:MAG: hypothetical protein UR38_C0003G0158 [Candidatus Woesebacteria bacterium GW2011_GWA2_33_28]KKP48620.1 MAG: hypothetical protein UR39_C0003G0155 [Candidatus Woesebacteria bacterium GW2011_GWA1_33_30]KKP49759.1 MAG: hypothetical protein UR40_C0004G0158 [Microgenomates group bacterium GW2011_GWC1_33_32]KKP52376.1 MAG: hypothetical protein UR44_C0003G0158 [Candidatus Woesebacteria bacterium GW2011_GWB1_33_38]KKP57106.1 MAG: hypothetical protein UR48_C0023G0005 [Microgenomates group bacteriu
MQKDFFDGREKVGKFENEEEATKLLSSGATILKGVEMVLGRRVDAKEFKSDETLRDIMNPTLDGETRYALLFMKKSLDPKESNLQ